MAEENYQKLTLISTDTTTGSVLTTPKSHVRLPSSGDLSPTRSGIRSFQEGESPKADEANDFKRYEQLAKICNQMKERETELNSKTQNLEELNRRNMDLQRQLAEMTELASKAQNSNESSNTIQGIRNTLSEKNYLIESIENELAQLAQDQKSRVGSDEVVISSFIKKITTVESQITQTTKKSTLATNKLLELQTQILGDAPRGVSAHEQAILQGIDESIQKIRAQYHTARTENGQLAEALKQKVEKSKEQTSKLEALRKQITTLQASLHTVRESNHKGNKQTEIQRLRGEAADQFKVRLAAVSEAPKGEAKVSAIPSKSLEELRNKWNEIQKEYDQAKTAEAQNSQILQANNLEIARLHELLKKDKHEVYRQLTPEEAAVKELHRQVEVLKKEHKQLKTEEKELSKDTAIADLEAFKKKAPKNSNTATPENIEALRQAKEKLQKELHEVRNLHRGLEKEQKNHAPAPLVEDYKNRVAGKREELALSEQLSVENVQLKQDFEDLYQRKEGIEWEKNPDIEDLTSRTKVEQQRIDELTELNKSFTKKLAQTTTKFNEFKTSYPDFELPKKAKGKNPEVKVEPKKEEKKEQKKDEKKAPAKKQTSEKSDPQTPKVEDKAQPKSSKKKNKGGVNPEPVVNIVEEVHIIEEVPHVEVAEEKPEVVEETPGKKKKGKKQPAVTTSSLVVEEKLKVVQTPTPLPPQQPSELEEIERKIMQAAAQSPAEQEVEKPIASKKSNKKQEKKKPTKVKNTTEGGSTDIQSDILSNLPSAKTETVTEGYKNLVLPAAVIIFLAVVFLMLR